MHIPFPYRSHPGVHYHAIRPAIASPSNRSKAKDRSQSSSSSSRHRSGLWVMVVALERPNTPSSGDCRTISRSCYYYLPTNQFDPSTRLLCLVALVVFHLLFHPLVQSPVFCHRTCHCDSGGGSTVVLPEQRPIVSRTQTSGASAPHFKSLFFLLSVGGYFKSWKGCGESFLSPALPKTAESSLKAPTVVYFQFTIERSEHAFTNPKPNAAIISGRKFSIGCINWA